MALPPQKFREAVFQLLYSKDFHESPSDDLIPMVMQELKITKKHALSALEKAEKIAKCRQEIDLLIQQNLNAHDLDRVHSVERTILRLCLYENKYEELPVEITISEAKRLVRKFSSKDLEAFVHAIIDTIVKKGLEK